MALPMSPGPRQPLRRWAAPGSALTAAAAARARAAAPRAPAPGPARPRRAPQVALLQRLPPPARREGRSPRRGTAPESRRGESGEVRLCPPGLQHGFSQGCEEGLNLPVFRPF